MGKAGVAVFWGGDPNGWVNPALFGYHRGVRYEHQKQQLVPDLAEDVFFTADQITLGYAGVGLYIAGKPLEGLGGLELNYGTSIATDVNGNVIGEFTSTEKIQAFGIGFSVAELLENLGRVAGLDLPQVSRYADVSLGHTWKSVQVDLAPANVTLGGLAANGEVDDRDHGLLLRLSPYNSIDYPGFLQGLDGTLRTRIDFSYGSSAVNYLNDATIVYADSSQDPIAKDSHWGTAFHVDLTLSAHNEESARQGRFGWLMDVIQPIITFGATSEHSQYAYNDVKSGQEIDLTGWEFKLLNIFTVRGGHIDDQTGTVIGDTSGWGAGFEFGKVGGLRYDHADAPQSLFLDRVEKEGFTAHVDPFELARRLR